MSRQRLMAVQLTLSVLPKWVGNRPVLGARAGLTEQDVLEGSIARFLMDNDDVLGWIQDSSEKLLEIMQNAGVEVESVGLTMAARVAFPGEGDEEVDTNT